MEERYSEWDYKRGRRFSEGGGFKHRGDGTEEAVGAGSALIYVCTGVSISTLNSMVYNNNEFHGYHKGVIKKTRTLPVCNSNTTLVTTVCHACDTRS
jgi:hypothetical protein